MVLENGLKLDDILGINYFKTTLTVLFKYIVYSIVTNKFVVTTKAGDVDKIDYGSVFHFLKDAKMYKLIGMFDDFLKSSKSKIESILISD